MAGIEAGKNLEIVPSLTASRTDSALILRWSRGNRKAPRKARLGLNVRWAVTQDLTANLALNPDFSQVEADVPQLEVNSQFALFYPNPGRSSSRGSIISRRRSRGRVHAHGRGPDYGAKLTGRSTTTRSACSRPRTRSRTSCCRVRSETRRRRSRTRITHSSAGIRATLAKAPRSARWSHRGTATGIATTSRVRRANQARRQTHVPLPVPRVGYGVSRETAATFAQPSDRSAARARAALHAEHAQMVPDSRRNVSTPGFAPTRGSSRAST